MCGEGVAEQFLGVTQMNAELNRAGAVPTEKY
jgi:hypothetical protein